MFSKRADYSPPATVYLGLSTADPKHDGSGWANPTYTGYAMKAITFAAAGSRAIAQTGVVTFDQCTLGSSTVGWWGLWDASTIGGHNLLAYGALSVAKTIVPGNTPSVASGQCTVDFAAGAIFTGLARYRPRLAFPGPGSFSAHPRQDRPVHHHAGRCRNGNHGAGREQLFPEDLRHLECGHWQPGSGHQITVTW